MTTTETKQIPEKLVRKFRLAQASLNDIIELEHTVHDMSIPDFDWVGYCGSTRDPFFLKSYDAPSEKDGLKIFIMDSENRVSALVGRQTEPLLIMKNASASHNMVRNTMRFSLGVNFNPLQAFGTVMFFDHRDGQGYRGKIVNTLTFEYNHAFIMPYKAESLFDPLKSIFYENMFKKNRNIDQ